MEGRRQFRTTIDNVECICDCPIPTVEPGRFAVLSPRRSGRRRRTGSFEPYIKRQMRECAPDMQLSTHALGDLNEMLLSLMDAISSAGAGLRRRSDRKTLTPNDLKHATKLLLPSNLYEFVDKTTERALTEFQRSQRPANPRASS